MPQLRRSTINASIATARAVLSHFGVTLPAWAGFSPDQWRQRADDARYGEVRDCMLGWDVTDFGSGDFHRIGRTLFTLRNGLAGDPRYPKPYAEKLLIDPQDQRAPAHYHRSKREDIVCVAGGHVLVRLTALGEDDRPTDAPLTVSVDGVATRVAGGETVRLRPGMSVTIPPRTVHQFWGEAGTGAAIGDDRYTLSREVSSVCDDLHDNVFLDGPGDRFPAVDEDEPPAACLCHEYPRRREG